MKRHQLTVQVREGYRVAVKEAQLPYPAAGQHLDRLPADAADAENGHMGAAQHLQQRFFLRRKGQRACFVVQPDTDT